MKQSNLANVFALIRSRGALTRKQISEKTDMSWGAVSSIISELLEQGYIVERKAQSKDSAGPIPSYLEVNGGVHFSVGLDINDTGLRGVLVNLKNEVVQSFWRDIDLRDKDSLLSDVLSFTEEILDAAQGKHVLCIGIAMQGIVDAKAGVSIRIPGRIEDWNSVPIAYIIEKETGIPTHAEHDPNCILYATCPLKSKEDTILIRADHGIGMSVIMDGRVIDKPGIFEIGHTVVVKDGIPCSCGKRGCLDRYASIRGIAKRAGKAFCDVCSDAANGNSKAQQYFNEAAEHLAFAIGNISHILAINNIVLCGTLWDHRELFFEYFCECIKKNDPESNLKFTFADVADAPLGASMIATGIVLRKIETDK
jgi:predicted NBD/HSP70 family sugar kinase